MSFTFHPTFCAASLKYFREIDNAASLDSVLISSSYLEFISFKSDMRSCNRSRCSFALALLALLFSFSNGSTPKASFASSIAAVMYLLTRARNLETLIFSCPIGMVPALNSFLILSSIFILFWFLATVRSLFAKILQFLAAAAASSPFWIKSFSASLSSISFVTSVTPYLLFAKKLER